MNGCLVEVNDLIAIYVLLSYLADKVDQIDLHVPTSKSVGEVLFEFGVGHSVRFVDITQ